MTLYELIKQVADIVMPGCGLDEYIMYTSDDDGGFLRTRYCWWNCPVKDRTVPDLKTVLLSSQQKIEPEQLKRDKSGFTYAKLQLIYRNECTPIEIEVNRGLGYCWIYNVNLENKTFTVTEEEPF